MHAVLEPVEASDAVPLTSLSLVARVLFGSDGTLTRALEALMLEPIRLVLLDQRLTRTRGGVSPLHLDAVEALVERRVLLEGARTSTRYVHAHSYIAVDRLDPALRGGVLTGDSPLGELFHRHRVETFKEIDEVTCVAADGLGPVLDVSSASVVARRRYRIRSGGRDVMFITEHLPDRW